MSKHSSSMDAVMDSLIKKLTATGSPYEIIDKEIDGISYPFFKHLPANLHSLYQMGSQYSHQPFLVTNDTSLSFAKTLEQVDKLSKILIAEYGIQKGDRVAIAMRNSPAWCITFMAVTAAGGVVVAMNSWWKTQELIYAVNETQPKIVFLDQQRYEYLSDFMSSKGIHAVVDESSCILPASVRLFNELLNTPPKANIDLPKVYQEDNAVIFYTSGSTGKPKGALSTHRMLLHTIFAWALTAQVFSEINQGNKNNNAHQLAVLVCLPLFHVTACYNSFLLSIAIGRKLVFIDKWDTELALQKIEQQNITHFIGVPTMSYELLYSKNKKHYDLSSLLEMGGGGAARPTSQVQEIYQTFQIPLSTGFGMTETNAIGCLNGGESYLNKPNSVGRATPPTKIKIIDALNKELPNNVPGEILVKSASNIKYYWNDPKASAELFLDGWVKTGDIGYVDDDGYLFIIDRKKDIVIRGGENISTQEVESVIATDTQVKEVCVFGIPDNRLGEIIVAYITPHEDSEINVNQLRQFLTETIAHYKVPGVIEVQHSPLPRGATGKIDKRKIRTNYLKKQPRNHVA